MNVLVSSAGRRVALLRAIQSDAREVIPGAKVFASDLHPGLSSACQVADGYFKVPPVSSNEFVEAIANACNKFEITLVIPTIDPELMPFARAADKLAASGIHVSISKPALVHGATDKRFTPELLARQGIGTPRELTPEALDFPLFVKPRDGSSSQDTMVARSMGDLTEDHLTNPRFIFQEYVDPARYDEFTVDLYYDRTGDLKCLVPRLRIATRAGEMSKGLTVRDGLYEFLLDHLRDWPDARGCITLQVFADLEREHVLGIEVNPRFGGGYPLSYAAGAHFPAWLMREHVLGETVTFFDAWETGLLMLRYDEGVFVHAAHG